MSTVLLIKLMVSVLEAYLLLRTHLEKNIIKICHPVY